jgi:DNA-binding FrmR family transcriptional regulator
VLVQVAAVTAALEKVALGLAEGHVTHCMAAGSDDPARRDEMTAELMAALGRLVR